MNSSQRREYSAKFIRTMKRMESPFVTAIAAVIRKQVTHVAELLRSHGYEAAEAYLHRQVVDAELTKPLTELTALFSIYAARKTQAEINKSAKAPEVKAGFGINEEVIRQIIAYLTQQIFIKAVLPISRTNRELILARIIEGRQKGWGMDKIAFELERWDMPLWRARMLVRTESLFAMQYGRQKAQQVSRWETESVWIAANDHRTRHSHRDVDGDRVAEGKRFAVPIYKGKVQIGVDMMLGPGDPHASAGNVINCRCSMSIVAKRDGQGKLISKRKISVILPGQFIRQSPVITV